MKGQHPIEKYLDILDVAPQIIKCINPKSHYEEFNTNTVLIMKYLIEKIDDFDITEKTNLPYIILYSREEFDEKAIKIYSDTDGVLVEVINEDNKNKIKVNMIDFYETEVDDKNLIKTSVELSRNSINSFEVSASITNFESNFSEDWELLYETFTNKTYNQKNISNKGMEDIGINLARQLLSIPDYKDDEEECDDLTDEEFLAEVEKILDNDGYDDLMG